MAFQQPEIIMNLELNDDQQRRFSELPDFGLQTSVSLELQQATQAKLCNIMTDAQLVKWSEFKGADFTFTALDCRGVSTAVWRLP